MRQVPWIEEEAGSETGSGQPRVAQLARIQSWVAASACGCNLGLHVRCMSLHDSFLRMYFCHCHLDWRGVAGLSLGV